MSIKLFDVVNFDLMNMIRLEFTPVAIEFVNKLTNFSAILAVSDRDAPTLRLVKAEMSLVERRAEGAQVIQKQSSSLHEDPIVLIRFNQYSGYALSIAKGGVPEVWDPETLELPPQFELISDTDLYEMCECDIINAEFSRKWLVVLSRDTRLFVFSQDTLKLVTTIDESLPRFLKDQENCETPDTLKVADVDRRLALEESYLLQSSQQASVSIDETETFVCFATPIGIKMLNLKT